MTAVNRKQSFFNNMDLLVFCQAEFIHKQNTLGLKYAWGSAVNHLGYGALLRMEIVKVYLIKTS